MEKNYEQLRVEICLFPSEDVIKTSGDGFIDDPWDDGFGGD